MISKSIENIRTFSERISRPVRMMEICGTHTMAAFRSGLRSLIPPSVTLISGPGCPVCVTPTEYVDRAIAISRLPEVTIATFGDMLRVPGTESSLELERARGAKVLIVYSPMDALDEAQRNPAGKLVFLGVGFETTTPTVAWTIKQASLKKISNFSVLGANKTIPYAMEVLLKSGEAKIDGFLCPGHVSAVIGSRPYRFIADDFHIPCVVTGFEPVDMILGVEMLLRQIVQNHPKVEIQYTRGVDELGNVGARRIMEEIFEESDCEWRGLGIIPKSGLAVREAFRNHDAGVLFSNLRLPKPLKQTACVCGEILRGLKTPPDCPLFRNSCTPAAPVGACMVSSEGTCAAYFKYSPETGKEKVRNGE